MQDYEIQFKVKNNYFLTAMRSAGYETAAALARGMGRPVAFQGTIGRYLNLKAVPLGRYGRWAAPVIAISEHLRCLPEDLFPPQHIERALPKNTAAVTASLEDVAGLLSGSAVEPEQALLAAQQSEALEKAMATLPEREQEILRRRFGLEGEPERRTEIAKDFERSATLIRVLEHRAIRRLREEIALQNARIEP